MGVFMFRFIVLMFGFSGILLASGGVDISKTDFVERVINFVIFVAILWYFAADKFKALLKNRRDDIIFRLEEIQNKVKTAKSAKEQAQKQLDDMTKKAAEIISDAKKEAILIAQKYEDQYKVDAETIAKNMESLMHFEQRKMQGEAIEEILDELFKEDSAKISNEDYLRILNRKVS